MCPCEGQLGSEYSPNEGGLGSILPGFFFFQFYQVYFGLAPLHFKSHESPLFMLVTYLI